MSEHHYSYGSGLPGCMYDNQGLADTLEEAIESALFPFTGHESELTAEELAEATADLREHGIHYFPESRRGELGATYVEVTREHGENPVHYEEWSGEWSRLQASDDIGTSWGPHKCALVESDSAPNRFTVFAFGAYAATYVAVGYELNPYHGADICDHLFEAAAWLKEHAPGHFSEPDYAEARRDICGETGQPDDMIAEEAIQERAEADLTYTESGYLPSWEWTIVGEGMTRDELIEWARNAR